MDVYKAKQGRLIESFQTYEPSQHQNKYNAWMWMNKIGIIPAEVHIKHISQSRVYFLITTHSQGSELLWKFRLLVNFSEDRVESSRNIIKNYYTPVVL